MFFFIPYSRLRHNVIKAGIKMISLSYAKISFSDVAQKLQLDSPEDAEYIVDQSHTCVMLCLMNNILSAVPYPNMAILPCNLHC